MKKRLPFLLSARPHRTYALLLAAALLLNLAARLFPGFADAYLAYVFPLWGATLGRLTSLLPFSVGEWLLLAGLVWAALLLLFACCLAVNAGMLLAARLSGRENVWGAPRIPFLKRFFLHSFRLLVILFLVMTLNAFLLYHCAPAEASFPDVGDADALSPEALASLRDSVVSECNRLALSVPHDADGLPVCDGDLLQTAREDIRRLSDAFPRLSGYSVRPKPLFFSGFISQQYMQGYYFPFSMEANYNDVMLITNLPFTLCHELAHTHGFIREDEANLIGALACIQSDDSFSRYSGYLGILNYVNNDFYRSVTKEEYDAHPAISEQVRMDARFLTPETWETVEARSLFRTETVKKAADTYVDTALKMNGVTAGRASYSHVVRLLLSYVRAYGSLETRAE